MLLGVSHLDASTAHETLHVLLKHRSDIERATKELVGPRHDRRRCSSRGEGGNLTSTAPPGGGPEALLATGLLDRFAGFVAELRGAGIPVSTTEVVDAMEALRYLPLEDRPALKLGLAAALVKQDGHRRMFDTMFELYFSLHYQGGEGHADGPSGPGTGPRASPPANWPSWPRGADGR